MDVTPALRVGTGRGDAPAAAVAAADRFHPEQEWGGMLSTALPDGCCEPGVRGKLRDGVKPPTTGHWRCPHRVPVEPGAEAGERREGRTEWGSPGLVCVVQGPHGKRARFNWAGGRAAGPAAGSRTQALLSPLSLPAPAGAGRARSGSATKSRARHGGKQPSPPRLLGLTQGSAACEAAPRWPVGLPQ